MDMDMDMNMTSTEYVTTTELATMMESMMTMMAVFQTSISTSLYSASWTPSSTGTYAATCLFLAMLAIVFRGIVAGKALLEQRWLDKEMARRYVVVNGASKLPISQRTSTDSTAKRMTLTENGVEEGVMVVRKTDAHVRPFRLSVDPIRACIDVALTGVGYLLMLAVMTMNVGYFMSILAGTFLGSLACGRYALLSDH